MYLMLNKNINVGFSNYQISGGGIVFLMLSNAK